jgi:hypothetical protein
VITHGQRTQFFRTFGNVAGKLNVSVYAWLTALELVMDNRRERGLSPLPDTVYHQFDGGGENANATYLAVAEMLVHRGFCKRVVLTRLPVGHTHEDIDQRYAIVVLLPFRATLHPPSRVLPTVVPSAPRFATIWRHIKGKQVLTPDEQRTLSLEAFKVYNAEYQPTWEDVMAVPDFQRWFGLHEGSKERSAFIAHCFKTSPSSNDDWTQLQFICNAHPVCPQFPLGVQTFARAYASSKVFEIHPKHSIPMTKALEEVVGLPNQSVQPPTPAYLITPSLFH